LFKFLFYLALIYSLSGCLSITTLQSGKTVGKNNVDFVLNGSAGYFSQLSFGDIGEKEILPVFEMAGKYGVTENFDMGLKLSSSMYFSPVIQQQFLGDKKSFFAASLGLESGINLGIFLFGVFDFYATVPLLASIHPKDNLSIYFSPRYTLKVESDIGFSESYSFTERGKNNYFGNSYGIIFGKEIKFAVDVSNFGKVLFKPSQISLGVIFSLQQPFKKNKSQ
jgi:hypothetical protein